jgi:hypothetical protein
MEYFRSAYFAIDLNIVGHVVALGHGIYVSYWDYWNSRDFRQMKQIQHSLSVTQALSLKQNQIKQNQIIAVTGMLVSNNSFTKTQHEEVFFSNEITKTET